MGFRINTNVTSLAAQRTLGVNNSAQRDSLSKLSSGSRINKSADDAAGLAISEKMKSQLRSTKQAERNAQDGISMIQTAEGGLTEINNILTRMRELSIQSSTDTIGSRERQFSNLEYENLKQEIQRISQVTEFNGKKMLDGTAEQSYDFQIGINNNNFEDRIGFDPREMNSSQEGLQITELNVLTNESARNSLAVLDNAIQKVAGQRAVIGALQNRLTSTINNLQVSSENLAASNSRIRDTDFAAETARKAKQDILAAAGTSVLAQANAQGQMALKLLG